MQTLGNVDQHVEGLGRREPMTFHQNADGPPDLLSTGHRRAQIAFHLGMREGNGRMRGERVGNEFSAARGANRGQRLSVRMSGTEIGAASSSAPKLGPSPSSNWRRSHSQASSPVAAGVSTTPW